MPITEPSPGTPGAACIIIKTGHGDCPASFDPALFQLNLLGDGDSKQIDLGFSGSRLLARLAQEPGVVVSRDELIRCAWSDRVVGQGSLNQQIYTLRQLLGDEKSRRIIQTLPRRGYLLNPEYVLRVEQPAVAEASSADIPEAVSDGVSEDTSDCISERVSAGNSDHISENAREDVAEAAPNTVIAPEPAPTPVPAIEVTVTPAVAAAGVVAPPAVSPPAHAPRQRVWPLMALLVGGAGLVAWFSLSGQAPAAKSSAQQVAGSLTVLALAEDERQQQLLMEQTQPLTQHLAAQTTEPAQLVLQKNGKSYDVLCIGGDGGARLLNLPAHDVQQPDRVAAARWQWCLTGAGAP